MKEFQSQLEQIMPAKELLFESTPGFGRFKQFLGHAIAHPAKINQNLLEYLILEYTKEGDVVLDPMAGSGSTGVVAALNGRNAVCVELERKFVDWAEEAKRKVEAQATLTAKGKIRNICGDSRKLSELLKEADAIVTSPPYSQSISKRAGGKCNLKNVEISTKTARSYELDETVERLRQHGRTDPKAGGSYGKSLAHPYSNERENIGNLSHGNVDAVITSPPYGEAQEGAGIAKRGYQGNKHSPTDLVGKRSYMPDKFESEQNISRLHMGNVDAVITSPPYADSKKGDEDEQRISNNMEKYGKTKETRRERHTPGRLRATKALVSGYSESEENIGNLPFQADAVITSPPYAEQLQSRGGTQNKERMMKGNRPHPYSKNKENIGNLPFDAVITSPPYSESLNESKNTTSNLKREERLKTHGHEPKDFFGGTARNCQLDDGLRYSHDPENIGNLKHGEVDAVITSPPYADAIPFHDKNFLHKLAMDIESGKTKGHSHGKKGHETELRAEYGKNPQNIGNLKKETYLEAMLKVYVEMWKVLKEGGLAIIVVKPFIRNKTVVDLPYHTWLLMQKCGFSLTKLFKLRLTQQSFWRILYQKKHPEVDVITHEYVLVCQK